MCDDCRASLAGFEAVGGAVLDTSDAAPMAAGALEAMLARLGAVEPARPVVARSISAPRGGLPAPLRDYVGDSVDLVKWKPVGMGVRQAVLPTSPNAAARLLHIPAGQSMPDHGHRGLELTLVLQGAFCDDNTRFGPGDVEIATPDLDHSPVAEAWQDCICLIATDAQLRFNSLVPRMMQRFLRI
jgi:putative transcriptional regulator